MPTILEIRKRFGVNYGPVANPDGDILIDNFNRSASRHTRSYVDRSHTDLRYEGRTDDSTEFSVVSNTSGRKLG
jgi:hypothetical protein